MIYKRAESEIKMRVFFMPKIALAPDGTVISLPAKVQDSARPEGARLFIHTLQCLYFSFKQALNQLLSLIHSYIVALFSGLLSAYNVSRVKSISYNKNRQQKDCHSTSLLLGLYIALFQGKPKSSNLNPLKSNSYLIATIFLVAFLLSAPLYALPIRFTPEQIANAIYKTEGGAKTKYPYGILTKYKHTTPRQACINTINHALKDWNGKGDFIVFLGNRYCPVGAKNDPKGLNKNWVRNVKYFLTREAI